MSSMYFATISIIVDVGIDDDHPVAWEFKVSMEWTTLLCEDSHFQVPGGREEELIPDMAPVLSEDQIKEVLRRIKAARDLMSF